VGKMKSLLMDYQDYQGYPIEIDEAALYDYQQQCHEEELMRQGVISVPLEPGIEEESYQLYMEGKLCGEQTNTALTSSDTNSKDGQTIVGLRKRRNMRK
tara:strand:+ start:108 stop:404 length:297 start_codon:yes stop_codon:yes gene_type:complete